MPKRIPKDPGGSKRISIKPWVSFFGGFWWRNQWALIERMMRMQRISKDPEGSRNIWCCLVARDDGVGPLMGSLGTWRRRKESWGWLEESGNRNNQLLWYSNDLIKSPKRNSWIVEWMNLLVICFNGFLTKALKRKGKRDRKKRINPEGSAYSAGSRSALPAV